jgi:mRNA interferase MazF
VSRAQPWEVWLVDFGDPVGSEQGGRRPAVVVASEFHARFPITITLVVPLTSRDRGLPHHIAVQPGQSGVRGVCYAKTEEITAVSERRFVGMRPLGVIDGATADRIRSLVRLMIV